MLDENFEQNQTRIQHFPASAKTNIMFKPTQQC
jgi:hypothetical protein